MSKYADTVYMIENCQKCKGEGTVEEYAGRRYTGWPEYMGGAYEPKYIRKPCPACSMLRKEIGYE